MFSLSTFLSPDLFDFPTVFVGEILLLSVIPHRGSVDLTLSLPKGSRVEVREALSRRDLQNSCNDQVYSLIRQIFSLTQKSADLRNPEVQGQPKSPR